MNLQHNYWCFIKAIPSHVCDQIVELGMCTMLEKKNKYGADSVTGSTGDWRQKKSAVESQIAANDLTVEQLKLQGLDTAKTYIRDSNVVFLDTPWLYEIIQPLVTTANKNAGWNFDWDYTEEMQFTKYSSDQFYGWHTDSHMLPFSKFDPTTDAVHKNTDGSVFVNQLGDPMPEDHNKTSHPKMIGKIRKLSVTVSLNDAADYEGGSLQFDLGPHKEQRFHSCTEIMPKGSVVVFPSHLYHQVTPVTKGTRYSLVAWNLGVPFK